MTRHSLEIHSENILPIIKKWLYSDKDIFIRELVSNACDALAKVKILREQGEIQTSDSELRVDITLDASTRTLKISDTGIGMTEEEVKKYIAQIAFSGAEEFMHKYAGKAEKDQIIGHFGLGFYSAYMVASKVEINTLSYMPNATPVFWSCDGSSEYEIALGSRTTRGTEITLYIDAESGEYLEESRLQQMLHHYCDFLPYPIYLNNQRMNKVDPLWIKPAPECTKEEYLTFYQHLYPHEAPPLFWLHLNVDYPFHLKGILYFPKIHRQFDINKSSVKLYCNRVFVADNCKDILPNYLMTLRGVIDSPDIPLNVSRSYLQADHTIRQLSQHIAKKVADSLSLLYRNDRESFLQSWNDISPTIKLGALEDERFYERVKELLIWKNTAGEWTTAEEYLTRNKERTGNKIFYTQEERTSPILEAYHKQNIEVLYATHFIDFYLISFLEKKLPSAVFQRIDADIADSLLDKSREKTLLDAAGKTAASHLADFIRSKLKQKHIEVEAKSLAIDGLPGILVIDEKQRRMQEYMNSIDPDHKQNIPELRKHTFVINTNSPLMEAIQSMNQHNPQLAEEMVNQVYEMALLGQKEMDPTILHTFVTRTTHLLEKLMQMAIANTP
jgi:molecular chaperone HtpG